MKHSKEDLVFAGTAFSVAFENLLTYANILKDSHLPSTVKLKISEFESKANFLRENVIKKFIYNGNSINAIQDIADLVALIVNLLRQGEKGLEKLAFIRMVIADENFEVFNENTHFAMPKKQKKK